ncbi:Integrase core domain protein [Anaplasma phagocytophilum]|nr:Integrase core domain protein [Anaplasma phagocytophilum]
MIAYASRTLTRPEKNYTVTEQECLAVVWAIGRFRPYLFGRPFTVVTDHNALCWLGSMKNLSGRLGRWILRLQEYNFTVLHKSGRKHLDADGLSRCPLPPNFVTDVIDDDPPTVSSLTPTTLVSSQAQDPWCARIIHHLASPLQDPKFHRKIRNFTRLNGILYKHSYIPEGERLLLVIPKPLRRTVLAAFHDDPTAGHLGTYKTYARLRSRYFWPGMYRAVEKYVQSCVPCQTRKTSPHASDGQLMPLPCPERPFDRVGIDLYGPLPMSSAGHRWIVVAIDHLTRYAETAPLISATAQEIAQFFLSSIVLRHGAPRFLLSDRGTAFLSALVQEVLAASRVIHQLTSAYHPQTNGLTERFNRTLSQMVSMYISNDHRNWHSILPFITFAYNTSVQSTTRFSPFFLVYGRDVSYTIDTLFPYTDITPQHPFLAQTLCRAEECRQLARLRTDEDRQQQKQRYDEQHSPVTYHPGDLVLVWTPLRTPGLSEKLLHKYLGPYTVLQQTSPVNYNVSPLKSSTDRRKRALQNVHVRRMKPFAQRSDQDAN